MTPSPGVQALSPRAVQVLDLLANGFLYKEIAETTKVTYATVHAHIRHIYEKLHMLSRTEAVVKHLGQTQQRREVSFPSQQSSLDLLMSVSPVRVTRIGDGNNSWGLYICVTKPMNRNARLRNASHALGVILGFMELKPTVGTGGSLCKTDPATMLVC